MDSSGNVYKAGHFTDAEIEIIIEMNLERCLFSKVSVNFCVNVFLISVTVQLVKI